MGAGCVAAPPSTPALAYHTTMEFLQNGTHTMISNDICINDSAGCHLVSLGLLILFDIYIFFWYPVHCSGCEDSILIFVQSLI